MAGAHLIFAHGQNTESQKIGFQLLYVTGQKAYGTKIMYPPKILLGLVLHPKSQFLRSVKMLRNRGSPTLQFAILEITIMSACQHDIGCKGKTRRQKKYTNRSSKIKICTYMLLYMQSFILYCGTWVDNLQQRFHRDRILIIVYYNSLSQTSCLHISTSRKISQNRIFLGKKQPNSFFFAGSNSSTFCQVKQKLQYANNMH